MSACQNNPVQSLLSKTGGQRTQFGRLNGWTNDQRGKVLQNNVEKEFLSRDEHVNQMMETNGPVGPSVRGSGLFATGGRASADWIQQFRALDVGPTQASVSEAIRIVQSRDAFVGDMAGTGTMGSTAIGAGPVGAGGMGISGMVPGMSSGLGLHGMYAPVELSSISAAGVNNALDSEFASLESELRQQQDEQFSRDANVSSPLEADHVLQNLDATQKEFRDAATNVYKALSSSTEKFQNSKFLSLMMNISEGNVTLRRDDYNSLYKLDTGMTVGNDHRHIPDTIADSGVAASPIVSRTIPEPEIPDITGLSSTEAALKVLGSAKMPQ